MSDSEDEESERRSQWQAFQLQQQALVFLCAGMQPAAQVVVGAAAPAGAAAAQVVVSAPAPAAPAAAQVVVGAAALAAPAAAQVVVRKRPSSEVDIDYAPEPPRQRLRLTMSSAQFLPAMQAMQAQQKSDGENVAEHLALEERKLALDNGKFELRKKEEEWELALDNEKFELRKKQEEWEIERKEKMAVADRKCKQHSMASAFDKI